MDGNTIAWMIVGGICLVILIWAYVSWKRMSPEEREKIRKDVVEENKKIKDEKKGIVDMDEKGQVICPHCGSTQIQVLRKRWSPATGFLTGKIDRVCVRCKNKF